MYIYFIFYFFILYIVYERIKHQLKSEEALAENEEEYEDSMGNVLSKKMYDDLRRQGLL